MARPYVSCNKCPTLVGTLIMGAWACVGAGGLWEISTFLNFAVNLATATKKPSFLGLHCVHPLFALGHNNPV